MEESLGGGPQDDRKRMERKMTVCHYVCFTDKKVLLMIKSWWAIFSIHSPKQDLGRWLRLLLQVSCCIVLVLLRSKGSGSPYIILIIFWEAKDGRPPSLLSSPLLVLSFHLISLSNGLPFIVNVGSLCERPRSVELSAQACLFSLKPVWVG